MDPTQISPVNIPLKPKDTTITKDKAFAKVTILYRFHQVIWYALGTVEIALAFRLVLNLFRSTAESSFAQLIYKITFPLASPFLGIINPTVTQGLVIEWSVVLGMLVYGILAFGLTRLLRFLAPVTKEEIENALGIK